MNKDGAAEQEFEITTNNVMARQSGITAAGAGVYRDSLRSEALRAVGTRDQTGCSPFLCHLESQRRGSANKIVHRLHERSLILVDVVKPVEFI